MMTGERNQNVLVTANAQWAARGIACFVETIGPANEVAVATELGEMDRLIGEGWPRLIVIAVPSRHTAHVELVDRVHARYPHMPLLIVSTDHQPALARHAMTQGVNGYTYTENEPSEVQLALQTAAAGDYHFPADVMAEDETDENERHHMPSDVYERLGKLTRRERQVMTLLGRGYANREIAEKLNLREGTVRIYVHRVIRQLGLRNRVDVALCASHVDAAQ